MDSYRYRVQVRIGERWENVSTHYVRRAAELACLTATAKGHEARVVVEDIPQENHRCYSEPTAAR